MEIDLSLEALPSPTEHQPVEFSFPAPAGARLALCVNGLVLEPFLRPGDEHWRWRWNPGPAVGLHTLDLLITEANGEVREQAIELRVMPRKIDQERYELLLDDLQQIARSLVYTLAGASSEGGALVRGEAAQRSRLEEYYALFDGQLDPFERAVRRIAARPRERLSDTASDVLLGQASALDSETLPRAARGSFDPAPAGVAPELQAALNPGGGLLPERISERRSRATTDIYEHRLLKRLLEQLLRRARFIAGLAEREAVRLAQSETLAVRQARVQAILAGCSEAQRRLRELQKQPFLEEVRNLSAFHGPTPLLQRDAAYREVYRMWQALRQAPYTVFDSPLFALPIADLPRLYECWCVLQAVHALLSFGGVVREQRLVSTERGEQEQALEMTISLVEDAPLIELGWGDATLKVRYQARYRPLAKNPRSTRLGSLDRHTRVPDIAIELWPPNDTPRVLVLDAKYRLDSEGGVPQDALADAYAYLGAIGQGGQRATLGSLLLYPGLGGPEYYPSMVGALPLLPGATGHLAQALTEWLIRK